jgi:hypothetical protein
MKASVLILSFAELLPAAKILFLIGDIDYLFSSDVGYFYNSLGKRFLKECFDLRHDISPTTHYSVKNGQK